MGRLTLRLDAGYCAVAAGCLVVLAKPLAEAFNVAAVVIVGLSGATAGWALLLRSAARAENVRPWLVVVFLANVTAAACIATLASARQADAVAFLLAAVAIEVAGFAAAQALALVRPLT